MKYPVLITNKEGREILINEEQVCSVAQIVGEPPHSEIEMSNGTKYYCVKPTWNAWLNDLHLRKEG